MDKDDEFKNAEVQIRKNAEMYHEETQKIAREIEDHNHQTALLKNQTDYIKKQISEKY